MTLEEVAAEGAARGEVGDAVAAGEDVVRSRGSTVILVRHEVDAQVVLVVEAASTDVAAQVVMLQMDRRVVSQLAGQPREAAVTAVHATAERPLLAVRVPVPLQLHGDA